MIGEAKIVHLKSNMSLFDEELMERMREKILFTNLTKEQFDDWKDFKNELQDELRGSVDLDEPNLV